MAHATASSIDHITEEAVKAAGPIVNGAVALGERARDFGESAHQRYDATAKAVRSTAAASPVANVLTAAGLGVVVGMLLARR